MVLSLLGALVGGLMGGLGLAQAMEVFQKGLAGGAQIALSYAMLGAFAVAIAHSGFTNAGKWGVRRLNPQGQHDLVMGEMGVIGFVGDEYYEQNLILFILRLFR